MTAGGAHLTRSELDAGLRALAAAPKDAGVLRFIVRRSSPGVHEPLDAVMLSVEEGVPGDGWSRRSPRDPDSQLAVMRHDIARLIADGRELTEFGDNLFVELDLSAANLPPGARLRVGDATVEVTPKARTGCGKFSRLFGPEAARFVNDSARRGERLRGVYWKVVVSGLAKAGARIEVLKPGC